MESVADIISNDKTGNGLKSIIEKLLDKCGNCDACSPNGVYPHAAYPCTYKYHAFCKQDDFPHVVISILHNYPAIKVAKKLAKAAPNNIFFRYSAYKMLIKILCCYNKYIYIHVSSPSSKFISTNISQLTNSEADAYVIKKPLLAVGSYSLGAPAFIAEDMRQEIIANNTELNWRNHTFGKSPEKFEDILSDSDVDDTASGDTAAGEDINIVEGALSKMDAFMSSVKNFMYSDIKEFVSCQSPSDETKMIKHVEKLIGTEYDAIVIDVAEILGELTNGSAIIGRAKHLLDQYNACPGKECMNLLLRADILLQQVERSNPEITRIRALLSSVMDRQ